MGQSYSIFTKCYDSSCHVALVNMIPNITQSSNIPIIYVGQTSTFIAAEVSQSVYNCTGLVSFVVAIDNLSGLSKANSTLYPNGSLIV